MNVGAVGGSIVCRVLKFLGPAKSCLGFAEPSMQGLEDPGLCKEAVDTLKGVCCLVKGVMALLLLVLTLQMTLTDLCLPPFIGGEQQLIRPMVQRSGCCGRPGLLPILERLL